MPSPVDPTLALETAARLVEGANAIVVTAGAGMGIDSGLPDFRGPQGFWGVYPALGRHGLDFTSIASPQAFRRQPRLAWGFYGHRLQRYRRTQPHQGFELLRKWCEGSPTQYWVFTSNVDGQFQKAGFSGERIVECHGSLHHLQCLDGCTDDIWPADDFMPDVDEARCLLLNDLPRCPRCGALARPNVLMFGDDGWIERRTLAQERRLEHWLSGQPSRLLTIELGAGTAIPTARNFSNRMAFESDAPVIRINPTEFAVYGNPRNVGLPLGALDGLLRIADLIS